MNNLQRMIVIPPELYNKLKDNFNDDKELSQLDKSMKEILKNKVLSDNEKWYIYRHNLVKFANKKRQKLQPSQSNSNSVANRKRLSNISTQTDQLQAINTKAKKIQTDLTTKDIGVQYYPPEDETYTFAPSKPTAKLVNRNSETDDDDVFDNDDEIRDIALSATPAGKRIKERKSLSSSDVRMFETDEGDIITVPIFERPKKDTSINRQLRSASSTKKAETQAQLNFPIRKKTSKSEKDKPKQSSTLDISKWKTLR